MANCYGENLRLTIFGSSHGSEIGMTLQGVPTGKPVDFERLQTFLNRRAPGQNQWSTARKESDIPHFVSGLADGVTNGETIHAVIYNENVQKKDYDQLKYIPRPGHADYTAWVKYGLDYDMAGGGPFSGRMTAPMCIAGGLCKQWLEEMDIRIGAHILNIGPTFDNRFDPLSPEVDLVRADFPVVEAEAAEKMQNSISWAKEHGDSVGGVVECAITGIPAGIGGPYFASVKSRLAALIYAIPAVQDVSFGDGFANAFVLGSAVNDAYGLCDGKVCTVTNHCGGIQGGITNGMPIILRVAFKPTPSIAKPQKSVNLKTMEEVEIQIKGRHDPCIVPRAVPVVEAAAAIAIYDLILGGI